MNLRMARLVFFQYVPRAATHSLFDLSIETREKDARRDAENQLARDGCFQSRSSRHTLIPRNVFCCVQAQKRSDFVLGEAGTLPVCAQILWHRV